MTKKPKYVSIEKLLQEGREGATDCQFDERVVIDPLVFGRNLTPSELRKVHKYLEEKHKLPKGTFGDQKTK